MSFPDTVTSLIKVKVPHRLGITLCSKRYLLLFLLVVSVVVVADAGRAADRVKTHDPELDALSIQGLSIAWPLDDTPVGMVALAGGEFIFGSSTRQKELGYLLDDRYAQSPPYASRKQRWYDDEASARVATIHPFAIGRYPVTQAEFKQFIDVTGLPMPDMTQAQWKAQGLVHPWERVQRYRWKAGRPSMDRGDHPVVLVDWALASAYCLWYGQRLVQHAPEFAGGLTFRLPTGAEFERAVRGISGRIFPWGDQFEPGLANHVYYVAGVRQGPFDTVPITAFPRDETSEGVRHLGGMVFEWTATPWPSHRIWEPGEAYNPHTADPVLRKAQTLFRDDPVKALEVLRSGALRHEVRGGSWDDLPGITRGSARHSRPSPLRHILLGFRCAAVPQS